MTQPGVGICIPNFNMADTLAESIVSATKQSYPNFRIYITDNCSTDNSWEIIRNLQKQYNNIIAVKNSHHVSMEENWNLVLRLAKEEEYVNILSADDILETNYVQECVKVHQLSHELLGYVYCERYHICDGQKKTITHFYKESGIIDKDQALLINIKGFHTAPCQLLINNQALKKVGYLSTKFGPASEMHLTLKLNANFNIAYINQELVGYNVSSGMSASQQMSKILAMLFFRLKNDIVNHHLPDSLQSEKQSLTSSINIFCARYCLANATALIKQNNHLEAKKLTLLACSFDTNIAASSILSYMLNHSVYEAEIMQNFIQDHYPNNPLKQPYSLPKNSIAMESLCV